MSIDNNAGWVSIHRKLQNSDIWNDSEPFCRRAAWVDLILSANYKERVVFMQGKNITVLPGGMVTSVRKLSERWRWSRSKTSRFLNGLEKAGMITQKRAADCTTIQLTNYALYQGVTAKDDGFTNGTNEGLKAAKEPQKSRRRATKEPQKGTNNKDNKGNKDNNKNIYALRDVFPDADDGLERAFLDFLEMRKKVKSPMTDRAVKMLISKLNTLSGGNVHKAAAILNQSVFNSWKGVFPLKAEDGQVPPQYESKPQNRYSTDIFEVIGNG